MTDTEKKKLVVIIQCDLVQNRCSGYNCTHAFYSREGMFAEYPEDTHYMTFTCGGCAGLEVGCKLQNLKARLARFKENEQEVIIHLSSCMVSDNFHHPSCPHKKLIQDICERHGFKVVLGSYISKAASRKREQGIYKQFTDC